MDRLASLLGSEARARLITHFVVHPDSRRGERALARRTGVAGKRSLEIELGRLAELGLLRRERVGRDVLVSRTSHSGWTALAGLVVEYAPALVLREALAEVPGVEAAFVFGSFARGDEHPDSDIDLFVYGEEIPDRALGKALLDASLLLDRSLDTKRYAPDTFRRDARPAASFLPSALRAPQVWLVGSPADLPSVTQAAPFVEAAG